MKTLKIAIAAAFLLAGVAYANQPGVGSTPADRAAAAKMMGKKAKPKKAAKPKAEVKESWTCSMHPEVHLAHKGQCPKCGMDLIKEKAKP